ncbi:MAG: DPP IV N-terminal domain-containing protein, partial [Myxococcota bacterium]
MRIPDRGHNCSNRSLFAGAICSAGAVLSALACGSPSPVRVPPAPPPPSSAAAQPPAVAPEPPGQPKTLTLERVFSDPPLAGTTSTGFDFSGDGSALAFLRSSEADSEVLDLWAVRLPDGKPEKLVEATQLVDVGSVQLSEEERMARERKRVRHRGIVGFEWCGKTSSQLLFPLGGDLYHVRLGEEKAVKRLTKDDKPELDPRCSPKGTFASFVRGGDLVAVDLASGKERQLTRGATATLTRGLAEFVAQEEMGRHRGYFWSPTEAHLAYLQVDESQVGVKVRPKIYADRTELYEQRYPAAGEPNAKVTLHVLPIRGGRTIDVALPGDDGYVARVDWAPDGEALWVQWQSRDQKKLVLFEARAPRFEPAEVLVETDDAWVELHDDLHVFEDGDRILWTSERGGKREVYEARRAQGWKLRRVYT